MIWGCRFCEWAQGIGTMLTMQVMLSTRAVRWPPYISCRLGLAVELVWLTSSCLCRLPVIREPYNLRGQVVFGSGMVISGGAGLPCHALSTVETIQVHIHLEALTRATMPSTDPRWVIDDLAKLLGLGKPQPSSEASSSAQTTRQSERSCSPTSRAIQARPVFGAISRYGSLLIRAF